MEFTEFKGGPASSLFRGAGEGLGRHSERGPLVENLRRTIIHHNNRDVGRFVAAVRRYAGKCSSGEYRLLLAVCALADFGHVADELTGGRAWQDITRGCDFRFRAAIAACVEAAP
jgi:hypothetical protein